MKNVLSAIGLLVTFGLAAQSFVEPKDMKGFDIVVNYPEYTVKTRMLKDSKKVKPEEDKVYNWYSANKLYETKGGFDGKLLDGHYKCFTLAGNLKEAGEFKDGLKSGKWVNWYPNGEIREILHWKKGSKNGAYKLFTENGSKMAEGNFKADKLDGKFKVYDGKNVSEKKYKNGEEIIVQPKQKKEKKVKSEGNSTKKEKTPLKERFKKIFKKKEKPQNAETPPSPKKEKKKDKKALASSQSKPQ